MIELERDCLQNIHVVTTYKNTLSIRKRIKFNLEREKSKQNIFELIMENFDNKNVDELAQIVDERICIKTLETLRGLGNMVGLQKKDVDAANRRNLKRWIRNIVEEKVDDGYAEDEAKKEVSSGYIKIIGKPHY